MTPRNRVRGPISKKISTAIKTFSLTEKSIFFASFFIAIFSCLFILWSINSSFLTDVPRRGGTLTEGIVGSPRFINPLLATSDADEDLTSLVYSGLLRTTPNGELINDLSKEYSISENGLEYTVTLKDDIYFHDGEPVTANDVVFTVKSARDGMIKSPKRINWEGTTVEKIDDKTVKFILKQPYAPFIENLTLGILPEHIWTGLDADQFSASLFNTEPIGSGPYMVSKVKRNSGGLPVSYQLSPFSKYTLGEPYIKNIVLKFYTNLENATKAYKNSDIDSISSIPPQKISEVLGKNAQVIKSSLPRIFGVFFNQSQAPVLVNKEVRSALNIALDKERIVREVLNGYGTAINGPLPVNYIKNQEASTSSNTSKENSRIDQAISLLTKNGWVLNAETGTMEKKTKTSKTELSFSIATGDAPELKQAALIITDEWRKIGAKVEIKVFETSDLNQNIIRPRKYDALLFGEIIGRDFDLYPFWHSSQRNDPGLNIAMYVNSKADKLLEDMRATVDRNLQEEKYKDFENLIKEDVPAVFTYSPDFIYLMPENIHDVKLGEATVPAERFANVFEWYIETNKVWKIFTKN